LYALWERIDARDSRLKPLLQNTSPGWLGRAAKPINPRKQASTASVGATLSRLRERGWGRGWCWRRRTAEAPTVLPPAPRRDAPTSTRAKTAAPSALSRPSGTLSH